LGSETGPGLPGLAQIRWLLDRREVRRVARLARLLADSQDMVRFHAARALGELRDPSAVPRLLRGLQDENGIVRLAAAEALARIGDPIAIGPLRGAIGREPVWHRRVKLRWRLWRLRSRVWRSAK
jgi:HEAT repeat protein